MKRILIAGGSGLIGKSLSDYLASKDYEISWLSRNPVPGNYPVYYWNPDKLDIDGNALIDQDVIVNLAGSSIGEGRWTSNRKAQILNSRIAAIQTLRQKLNCLNLKFPQWIQASAIGYYGNCDAQILNEEATVGKEDFLSRTCAIWEQEATQIKAHVEQLSIVRTGLYLSPHGGMWPKLIQTKKFGFLNYFGSGNQMYSWIHESDYNRAIEFLIENKSSGLFNFCTPNALSNKEMVKVICKFSTHPCFNFPVPAIILKLILGEKARLLLNSSRVYPQHLLDSGFKFKLPEIKDAILELIG